MRLWVKHLIIILAFAYIIMMILSAILVECTDIFNGGQ